MYFLTAKSTKNSPTDAFADFVPSNVRPPKRRVLGDCANIHKTGALSLGAEQEQPTACVPGAGGWQRRPQARADSVLFAEPPQPLRRVFLRRKGLILLRPLNAGRRRLPRRTTCGWFWCNLLPSKGSYAPRAKTAALLLFAAKKYKSTPRLPQKRRLLKKPPENTQYYLIYGVVRNCIAASRSRGWHGSSCCSCPCANRRGTRRPPCSAG